MRPRLARCAGSLVRRPLLAGHAGGPQWRAAAPEAHKVSGATHRRLWDLIGNAPRDEFELPLGELKGRSLHESSKRPRHPLPCDVFVGSLDNVIAVYAN